MKLKKLLEKICKQPFIHQVTQPDRFACAKSTEYENAHHDREYHNRGICIEPD